MHKLSSFRTARTKMYAWCRNCDREVEAVKKPRVGGGFLWRCSNEQKAKRASEAKNVRKRAARAVSTSKRRSQQEAEWLWRQIVFERAGRKCEACGKPFEKGDFQLQAHHIVKRSQSKRLLLDPANGMALCAGHHQYAERDPIWCMAILRERDPGIEGYLLDERKINGRIPFEDEMDRLKKVAAMYEIEVK